MGTQANIDTFFLFWQIVSFRQKSNVSWELKIGVLLVKKKKKKNNVKKDTQLKVYKPHRSFLFFLFFFPFAIFWCTKYKFVLVLRTFFLKHKLHAGQILNFSMYLPKCPENRPKLLKIFSKWNRNTLDKISGVTTVCIFSWGTYNVSCRKSKKRELKWFFFTA